jgi:predicted short-subunit dehydrogenase-like oxidoreductase (DUF2520 family)
MQTLNIIGAGHVGGALGIVLRRHEITIQGISCRTQESAVRACHLIEAGTPMEAEKLAPADLLMITTSDNALADIAQNLKNAVRPGTVAFHCSGATPSSVLSSLRTEGAHVGSIHPVKTFTDPLLDAETFPGTWCGIEGDEAALAVLRPLFEKAGARLFAVDPAKKTLYHAATVFMCSYIFPLIEAGFQCYEAASVDRAAAADISGPLVRAAVDNALRFGPGKTMTGPLSRGDDTVVGRQLAALTAWKPELAALYTALGAASIPLARQKGAAPSEKLEAIAQLLKRGETP